MKVLRIQMHTDPFTTTTYAIMEKIAIDAIGPLPVDEKRNCT